MPAIATYEQEKHFSVFDECPEENWVDTESYYDEVAESRRAYHPLPLKARSHGFSGMVIFPQVKPTIKNALEIEFNELAERWNMETEMMSSTSDIVTNFNYYRIISLGKEVVPFILRELQRRGGQWYLALRVLTNENPVPPEYIGNIKKMKEAWIEWGKQRDFI